MRGLRAALWKDVKLFQSGAGFAALLMPLLLLAALQIGGGDLAKEAYVQPFPIALRDEDGTVMSRSLMRQMEEIALFSQILPAAAGESGRMLLERGAAAVVTIPKDFFYELYSMENLPVHVALNDAMPLESAIFRSVFTSVMGIVGADQSVIRAVYRHCYGDLTPELSQQIFPELFDRLLKDALDRQRVFDTAAELSGAAAALERTMFACAFLCSVFFSLWPP